MPDDIFSQYCFGILTVSHLPVPLLLRRPGQGTSARNGAGSGARPHSRMAEQSSVHSMSASAHQREGTGTGTWMCSGGHQPRYERSVQTAHLTRLNHAAVPTHGGGRRDWTLYADSPPPPSLLGFGPEVLDYGRRRRPKEILLDLVEGEKMGFHPMCLYSKYSVFFRRTQ